MHINRLVLILMLSINGSSSSEVVSKKGLFENFAKFTGKNLRQNLFYNKSCRPEPCNLINKETLARVFSCEYCEIFKNTFFYRTPSVAASASKCSVEISWNLHQAVINWVEKGILVSFFIDNLRRLIHH